MEQHRVLMESYGCTMNHGEARIAADILQRKGYTVLRSDQVHGAEDWDLAMIFTCDVISTTERRMMRRIEELRKSGNDVYVAGCLPAVSANELKEKFPAIRLIDTMGIPDVRSSLDNEFPDVIVESGIILPSSPIGRIDTIVPISTGCTGSCSYCITRRARGPIKSYSKETIIDRIREGIEKGRKEILLTSQDTAAYGIDINNSLGSLIKSITSSISGSYRIRIGMMNPVLASNRLERIMDGYSSGNVFNFIHVPVQSGSDRVLASMNRGYSASDFMNMVKRVRERYPKITISTDIITGFPGETEEDHQASVELLKGLRPDVLNITRFSSRPGTPADKMRSKIKGGIRKDRSRILSALHLEMLHDILSNRLGRHSRCLVAEIGKPGTMMARDENYTPIVIKGEKEMLGSFVDIFTTGIGPTYLTAEDNWSPVD